MSIAYRDRVAIVSVETRPDLACVIGLHEMDAILSPTDRWIYTTVDSYPICPEHILLIADTRTSETIPESRIKKVLIDRDVAERQRKQQEHIKAASAQATPGWIYYVRIDDLIKIGFTANLQKRILSYPPNAVLLAVHPGTQRLEHDLHRRFAELRARGREWFRPGTVLEDHIVSVVAQFGAPSGVVRPMRHAHAS